ncbi:MAG: hypothetical protein ACI82S_001236 [Patiriisocius sp.]|jgi:hypothetical protein
MYTGKSPQDGGWVSNSFLTPQAAIDRPSNAFTHPQSSNKEHAVGICMYERCASTGS